MYFGPDSFTFRVHDASVDSAVATISIEIGSVNDQPIADDQNVGINEDTPLDIILTGNDTDGDPPDAVSESIFLMKGETTSELVGGATSLLSNDSDIEGHNLLLSTTPVTGPASGTLVLNSDGSFSYTHDDSFTAVDSFRYEVCDDGVPNECSTAIVSITIDVGIKPEVIHSNGFE